MANKFLIGFMILVVLTASVYVLLPDKIRIDVENTKTTFKVYEDGSWILGGTERTILFDGTTKMRASSRSVDYFIDGNNTKIIRTANFKDNITAIDTYIFDGNVENVELYPVEHIVEIINGEGKLFVYEVNDLEYFGETINGISSPQEFGHNMKIEWEDGNYYSKIYKYFYKDIGKLTIKYRLDESYEKFNVRLFDPVFDLREYYDTGGDVDRQIKLGDEKTEEGQSFTPQDVYTITTITVWLKTTGNEGTLWGHILNTSDSTSATACDETKILATITNVSQGTIGETYEEFNLTFSDNNVTSWDNKTICYWLRSTGADASNMYELYADGSNPTYTYGKAQRSYNNGANDIYENIDHLFRTFSLNTIPQLIVHYPANISNFSVYSVTMNATVFDDVALTNVSLYVDGSLNQTNSSGLNNSVYTFDVDLADGEHLLYFEAFDDKSINNVSDIRYVYVDTTDPFIGYNPSSTNSNTTNITSIVVNVTATDTNLDHVRFSWNGTNETFANNASDYYWETKSGLSDNNYTFYAWANDTFGFKNFTESRTVSIDATAPVVSILTPSNASILNLDYIFINVSVIDANPFNVTYRIWNDTGTWNTTTYLMPNNVTNNVITFIDLAEGTYRVNVTVVDIFDESTTTSDVWIYLTTFGIYINSIAENSTSELGTLINVTANSTANVNICLDVIHPIYGINTTCGLKSVSLNVTIDYLRKETFWDATTSKIFDFKGTLENILRNLTLEVHHYDEIVNMTLNISGSQNPEDLTIFKVNTGQNISGDTIYSTNLIERFFHGFVNGSNIYLNKLFDDSTEANLTYSSAAEKIIYLYLDDSLISTKNYIFLFNITGQAFGFSGREGYLPSLHTHTVGNGTAFPNYDFVDTTLTSAHLDKSGYIFTKNVTSTHYVYDDFTDGSVNTSLWSPVGCTIVGGSTGYTTCLDETGGKLRIRTSIAIDRSSSAYYDLGTPGSPTVPLWWDMDVLNFSLVADYNADETGTGTVASGVSYVQFGGNYVWNLTILDAEPTYSGESADADLDFTFEKINRTHWKMTMRGTENATGEGDPIDYYNKAYRGDETTIAIDNFEFPLGLYASSTSGAGASVTNNYLYLDDVSRTIWSRENGTLISNSVYDASGDITIASMNVSVINNSFLNSGLGNVSLYMSADNGDNWELTTYTTNQTDFGVANFVFTNVGTNLKFRIDFNSTDFGNSTPIVVSIFTSVPEGNPTDIDFDFGNNGTIDYTFSGELNSTNNPQQINLSRINITSFFTNSRQIYNHTYKIPLSIYSNSVGQIDINHINFTYDPNPIKINYTFIQTYLDGLSFATNKTNITIPMTFKNSTSSNSTVTFSDLRYDYAGGNNTIIFRIHDYNYVYNVSRNIIYYYSRWDYSFIPNLVSYIFFGPQTPTDKNVIPYGQSDDTPILNITNYGYNPLNASLSVYLNGTLACVNTTLSQTNNKSQGYLINQSWHNITNLNYLEYTNISLWADYNCNYSNWYIYNPQLYFRQCIYGGHCSEDIS